MKTIFPIESFASDFDGKECSKKDYEEECAVWNSAGDFERYFIYYLQKDVMLLAAVMENLIIQGRKVYDLDPSHYYSLPGYTFDSALKFSNITLELIKDTNIFEMLESAIRGGLSFAGKRYVKANNKYLADFDPEKPTSFLLYIDARNLYGHSMSEPLPWRNFHLIEMNTHPADFQYLSEKKNILQLDSYGEKCYFYSVDGYFDPAYHDYLKEYPFFPENIDIPKEMFSEFQQRTYSEGDLKPGTRLLSTLLPKSNYVTHFRMLKFALTHGFILTKVNKIIICDQKPWLRDYITLNRTLRADAVDAGANFLKRLFKDMNNMFFGKTVEQVRNRTNVVIKTDGFSAEKIMCKPTYRSNIRINEDLIAIETTIQKLLINKPIYNGAAVLELSKLRMMEFHYDTMMKFYNKPGQLSMCYTDTDSFVYEIKTDDVYSDMLHPSMISQFDFSEYPDNALQFANTCNFDNIREMNKQLLGKFKDELGEFLMDELIALKSKLYSFTIQIPVSSKKMKDTQFLRCIKNAELGDRYVYEKIVAKGVRDSIRELNLSFSDYKFILKKMKKGSVKKLQVRQLHMKSKKHKIHTASVRKVALSATDTKRYLLNAIDTLPFGHKDAIFFNDNSIVLDTTTQPST